MFHHVWETFFNLIVGIFLENALNLWILTRVPIPQLKLRVEFLENLFPPREKGWRELWFVLLKFNEKIWRWPGTLINLFIYLFKLFYFCMVCNFFKWNDVTVLWIVSRKSIKSIIVVLSLLPLLCNHGNLTLKLYIRQNTALSKSEIL